MELGVSHVQNLSSSTPIIDNIFDKYNKNLVPIRSLSDHDNTLLHSRKLYTLNSYAKMFTVEDNIFQTLGYSSVTQNLNKKSVSDFHICKIK